MKKRYHPASLPPNEDARLEALRSLHILDTAPESQIDDLTVIASRICGTPIALVTLVDKDRQWFKSKVGIQVNETSRDVAFCAHAIHDSKTFIIENALEDDRFAENPFVEEGLKVRFYAGAPLKTSDGFHLGTLCVIDTQSKKLNAEQIDSLEKLAQQIVIILERQKTLNSSNRLELFMSNVVDLLPDRFAYLDSNLRYCYVNQAFKNSWKPSEIIGKTPLELLGKEAFSKIQPFLIKAMVGEKQDFHTDFQIGHGDQKATRFLRIRYIPDQNPKGEVLGIFVITSDHTELKNAEINALNSRDEFAAALVKSEMTEKAFRAIFENFPVGVLKLDSDLRFILVNDAFTAMTGYSESELKKLTIFDITHPEDRQLTTDIAQENTGVKCVQKRYLHKNGHTIWVRITIRTVMNEDSGKPFHFSTIEDITDMRQREADLKIAQSQMINSAKLASLGEMASGIAHEINNPLSIISAKVQILNSRLNEGHLSQEKATSDLQVIHSTVDRISKIISGLQAFSRSSTHDPMTAHSFSQIMEQTVDLCRERFRHAGVKLTTHSIENDSVECRPSQISQIILNLLGNSFDAIQSFTDKWVNVDIVSSEKFVSMRFTDSGLGIAPHVVQKLMQPFFTTKEAGKGTGLGLSISRGIAENHKGSLRYDPTRPNTCFILELPKSQNLPTNSL